MADYTPSPGLQSVMNEQIEYALNREEMFEYLQRWSSTGPGCYVCGSSRWGVSVLQVGGAERVLPDGMTVDAFERMSYAERAFAARSYSFTCVTCAHLLSFNANWLATRVAIARKEKANAAGS
jgi:hypothetical protein